MNAKRKLFPVGLMIAGFWILFNPNISILDPIPDAIGYALILFSLRHLAAFAPYMGIAADAFRKLFYISLAKIPALFVMAGMGSQRVTVTVFSLAFAVLELLFLFPAIHNLFEGFFYLGSRFGCAAAIAEEPRKPDAVRMMTYIFISVKMALSTLPDFLFLFEYDPLTGDGFTVTTTQYIFVVLAAFLAVLVVGIVWLTYILPYLGAIKKEQNATPILSDGSNPESADIALRESHRLRISLPYFLLAMGLCLSVDAVLDYQNVLPDYLAGIAFLALALLLLMRRERFAAVATAFSASYTVACILHAIFRNRFYEQYVDSDLTRIPAADTAYLPVILTSLLSEALFVLTLLFLLRSLYAFRKAITPAAEARTEVEKRFLAEGNRGERKQTAVLFSFATLSALLSFLNTLLVRYNAAVPMQPGYSGTAVYLPRFGSFWILALVFSLAAAAYGAYLSSTRVDEIRTAIEDADLRSDPAV